MEEAIPTMRRALTLLAGGDVVMPLRTMLGLPGGDRVMGLMPSYMGGIEALGVKVVAAFPANSAPSTTPIRAWCCCSTPNAACCARWSTRPPSPPSAPRP